MSEKSDKLRAMLAKEKERRIKLNNRIEILERRIQEEDSAEVNEMVRTAKVTPEQLAALLRQSATTTPNPDALAVVSGGQGEGEDITEAKAMADYLTAHGIDSARIVQEDQSRTTRENLENSFAILRARGYDPANGVGIVTSEYHLYRAKRMVRALGAEPVGIAAETTLPTMRVNYFIREAFAAAYMQLAGTLY